jgi:hypothetical protein
MPASSAARAITTSGQYDVFFDVDSFAIRV